MKKINRSFFFLFVLFAVIAFSCKTTKQTVVRIGGGLVESQFLIDSVSKKYLDFQTISIKFSTSYKSENENISLSGRIRIKRDSTIWVSLLAPLGIEVARMVFTPDSVKLLTKLPQKRYFLGNYTFFEKMLGTKLNYQIVEALLTNRLFAAVASEKKADVRNFFIVPDSASFTLSSMEPKLKQSLLNKQRFYKLATTQDFTISNFDLHILETCIEDHYNKRLFSVKYADFVKLNNTDFPSKIKTLFTNKGKLTQIGIEYTGFEINTEVEFPFKINSSYKPFEIK